MSKSELRKRDPIGQILDSLCNSSNMKEENVGSAFKPIIKNTTPPTFMPKHSQIFTPYFQTCPQMCNRFFQNSVCAVHTFPYGSKCTNQMNTCAAKMIPEIANFPGNFPHFQHNFQNVPQQCHHQYLKPSIQLHDKQLFSDINSLSLFPWMKTNMLQSQITKSKFPVGMEKPQTNPTHPPRYQCESCHKSYSTFGGLSKHRQFHCVNQVKKEFSCKFCGKSYGSLGALKMHIRTHTLPCKCKLCGKAFSRPWLLQGHVRTHTGEKPFRCDHCGRAFADRSNLRAHLQTHSDVKKYGCKNCSKTFSRMSLLVKHKENNNCVGLIR